MKNNQKRSFKLTILVAVLGLLVAIPLSSQAGGVTQLAFLQTLVQVSGDSGQFGSSSTAQDFIQWAQAKGMTPAGGWNPSATLSKAELAQLLVQLLNLNPKKGGGDYIRILQREGIELGDEEQVSNLGSLFNQNLFTLRIPNSGCPVKHGNNGVGNGEDAPPPGWLNPKNPHFGQPQNDGPGTGPGHPNNKGPKN